MSVFRVVPWLTQEARRFLESFIRPESLVLEFGAGGSTIWLSQRCRVITVEHDPTWLARIDPCVEQINSHRILVPRPYPTICQPWAGPPPDLVLIDGRDRLLCAQLTAPLLPPGGVLMLDNAEREGYQEVGNVICAGWAYHRSEQTGPDDNEFWYKGWQTDWWIKPAEVV